MFLSGRVLGAGSHPTELSEAEHPVFDAVATLSTSGFGHFLEQATRPQTIGYAPLFHPSPSWPDRSTMRRLRAAASTDEPGGGGMQVKSDEPEIIERLTALDVGKAEVVCCAGVPGAGCRVPGAGGRRMQEVRLISTMTVAPLGWVTGRPGGVGW